MQALHDRQGLVEEAETHRARQSLGQFFAAESFLFVYYPHRLLFDLMVREVQEQALPLQLAWRVKKGY